MIRELQKTDIDKVAAIWLDTNLKAHYFIPAGYWERNFELVKEMLSQAEVYVYEKDTEILGFVGLDDEYIEGIFISDKIQSQGIGKQLLNYVKDKKHKLLLNVYQKNVRAISFYRREGFEIQCEGLDEATGEKDYVMVWQQKLYNGRPKDTSGRKEKEIKVYDILDSLHIPYIRADHEAVMTMEACEEIDKTLGMEICKNLFLCNRKKTAYYLLLMPGNKALKTKELSQQIPTTRLSFASGEDMEAYLNVTPGSATVMGLIFDPENKVQLLVDEELLKQEEFGCHPCVNTSTIKMKTEDVFGKFLEEIHHDYITVKLSDGNEQE